MPYTTISKYIQILQDPRRLKEIGKNVVKDSSHGNLRLLCTWHNRMASEREYGKNFMRKHTPRERFDCVYGENDISLKSW